MSGHIKLDRDAFDHPLLKDPERFRAWFWMVARAAWKSAKIDVNGKTISIRRSQFCTSRDQLAKAWGWSPSAVERFLTRLQTEQMIGRETGQGRSIITITNYEKYQADPKKAGQATGQRNGQRSDSRRTAKEEGEEGKKEEPDGSSIPPTPQRPKDGDHLEYPDWLPVSQWNAFYAMRVNKRAEPTAHAVDLLLRHLDQKRLHGHDPGKVLDQSTVNNWTDIYDLKDNRNGTANRAGSANGTDRRSSKLRAVDDALDFMRG